MFSSSIISSRLQNSSCNCELCPFTERGWRVATGDFPPPPLETESLTSPLLIGEGWGEVFERVGVRLNSLFHRKCEKICKIKNSDYNHKNSLFHRICEFHYFSELLDNIMLVISKERID